MTEVHIGAIVEGHGECEAVPILIRRIAQTIHPGLDPKVFHLRVPASKLMKEGELERAVTLAGRKLRGGGGIVVILDCDWPGGCPASDGPVLLERARAARGDMPVAVILAKMEFGAWFLAAAESLRGKRGLPVDLEAPADPEAIRGAKGWLSERMDGYSETTDQPALAAQFNLEAARTSDSFDKCFREIDRMLRQLLSEEQADTRAGTC